MTFHTFILYEPTFSCWLADHDVRCCCCVWEQPGQVVVDLMVRPPVAGEPSYDLYHQETTGIFESLKRRALRLTEAFNKLVRTHTRPLVARHAPPHTHTLTGPCCVCRRA
jgi:hypothetical protein